MTTAEENPSLNHVFVFYNVKSNIGSAYDQDSGNQCLQLRVMESMCLHGPLFHGQILTYFHRLSQVFTSLTTDSYKVIVANTSTGVIVVSLNRGDAVFIRTHHLTLSHGTVLSNDVHGRSSFSGWKLKKKPSGNSNKVIFEVSRSDIIIQMNMHFKIT